jgi:hypothetical protein
MNLSKKLIKKIEQLDSKGRDNEFLNKIKSAVSGAVSKNEILTFVSFTCSTINPSYLFTNTPWRYIKTNPENNNLSSDIIYLESFINELRAIYPKVQLKILIGNTDPYYIYLQQFKAFPNQKKLLWQKFAVRWKKYQKKFTLWADKITPNLKAEIISWYELEKGIEKKRKKSFEKEYEAFKNEINKYFSQDKLDWELKKLETQFGKGKYFDGLRKPDESLLKDWVIRKFTEYAIQAAWIYENMGNVILIQNEKPSELRSQMYQPAIKNRYNDSLPIVYFFGVDNEGYQ